MISPLEPTQETSTRLRVLTITKGDHLGAAQEDIPVIHVTFSGTIRSSQTKKLPCFSRHVRQAHATANMLHANQQEYVGQSWLAAACMQDQVLS